MPSAGRPQRAVPECDLCGACMPDWQGKIIVDCRQYIFFNRIPFLMVLCNACSEEIYAHPAQDKYHTLWHLAWLRDERGYIMESVEKDLCCLGTGTEWGFDALDTLLELCGGTK